MPKKNRSISPKDALKALRIEAEKSILGSFALHDPNLSSMDIKDLMHNIQVQQIELEMQNDELKLSNEELELQRARFAGLFDLAPIGYFILNHYGIIEDVNSTGIQLLHHDKKHIINKRFQSFIPTNEWDIFSSFLQSLKNTSGKHTCQISVRTLNNDFFYAQLQGIAIQKNQTENTRYYIAVIDITEKTNASIKLTKLNERLNMALSASLAGIWEINLKTGHIFLDDYSKKIFGFEYKEFDGRSDTFLEVVSPDDRDGVQTKLLLALNNKHKLDIDYRILLPDGTIRYVNIRGHVVYSSDQLSSFVGIATNIDQKKRIENEAEALKLSQHNNITAAALQAQENERKRISESLHDSVSQLLYGIKLNLDNQQTDANSLKKVGQLLEMAIQETRNISFELTPSVLTDFGLPTTIDEMCKRLTTPHLTIKATTSGFNKRPEPDIEINIFRIVQELVNNCIKHAQATVIHITVLKHSNMITMEVKDNGSGFAYDENSKALKGTGLASIKNRLNLFNGTMQIKSNPGHGTSVVITLK